VTPAIFFLAFTALQYVLIIIVLMFERGDR
jgi:hypothetical protein